MRATDICAAVVVLCAAGCSTPDAGAVDARNGPTENPGVGADAAAGATDSSPMDGGSSPVDDSATSGTDAPTTPPIPPPSGPIPAWVATLPLWQWYEIPNTKLSSVQSATKVPGINGPRSKIESWCGATLRRLGSVYILGAAGGHGDYAGNEVDALPLYSEAPAWVQLRGPTETSNIVNRSEYYLDERPSATHTYQATQFINAQNRMFVVGGGSMNLDSLPPAPAGWPYAGTSKYSFSFDLGKNDWDPPTYVAAYPGNGDGTGALTVKHPLTDDIYYSRNYSDGWYRWTQATNTWSKLSNVTRAPWYAGAAIDPTRGRMLLAGGYRAASPAEVRGLDGTPVAVSFSGAPAAELATAPDYTGVLFDEANDRFLVVMNAGTNLRVLRVHPETWAVDAPPMTGTTPAARPQGVQNAAQYVPELKGFVIANAYDGNVFFVRTAP